MLKSETLFLIKKALSNEISRLEKLAMVVGFYEVGQKGCPAMQAVLAEKRQLENAVTEICKVYEAQFAVSNPG
jgi:hypothetical protein